jgi:hypothetical protein
VHYTNAQIAHVFELLPTGLNSVEIAKRTGVNRWTVKNWRHNGPPRYRRTVLPENWHPPDEAAYSYLLGIYLGDGHVANPNESNVFLRVTLDSRQIRIIAEVARAISSVLPEVNVRHYRNPPWNVAIIQASSRHWLRVFPQHGPGRKHKRRIALEPWQTEICHRHPKQLLRGLIHSDGSRCINRFSIKLPSGWVGQYAYPRYFFSNLSADIRGIFCEYCDKLGVRWTQSNHRNISVSHRDSVALLDSFIGPKG